MLRLGLLSMVLLACGGADRREVSTFRMPHGGACPDDKGCEAPFVTEAQYANPDSSRPQRDPTAPVDANAKAPEPDCDLVGQELASLDVGNYADEATRAPSVAKHAARCRSEALTLEERQCILQSQPPHRYYGGAPRNPAMTAWCAQRMFPHLPAVQLVPTTRCASIEAAVRQRLPRPQQLAADQRRTWDAKLEVLVKSCQQDRWTADFGTCVEKNGYVLDPLPHCFPQAPYPLQLKISERTAAKR